MGCVGYRVSNLDTLCQGSGGCAWWAIASQYRARALGTYRAYTAPALLAMFTGDKAFAQFNIPRDR